MKAPRLSIVVPIFNESGNVPVLLDRLSRALKPTRIAYEIICVDDGSSDDSLHLLTLEAKKERRLKIVSLSRNFGHQMAITAGLEYAKGEAVVIIDADLQDPPELIPELVSKWEEGYDVVYALRQKRAGETYLKLLTARIFYRLLQKLTAFDIPVDTGDFRLMSRRVVNIFLSMPERQRYVRGMIAWIGFRQTGVPYEREERNEGATKYSYGKMLRLAFDGITSFSYIPLQLASYLGFICAGLGFLLVIYAIYEKFFGTHTMQGWASTVVITVFLGGIQLVMIGVLGEYIGRNHVEMKKRPLYVVRETLNLGSSSE